MVPERRLTIPAAAAEKPRAHVRPKLRMRTFYLRWSVTVVVAILAVSRFAAAAQIGYAIDSTQAQLQVAKAQELALQGEVAAQTSAGRLAAIATKLKLAPAPPVMAVTVPQGGSALGTAHVRSRSARSGVLTDVGALIRSITKAVTGM